MITDSASLTAWSYWFAAIAYAILLAYLLSLGPAWRSSRKAVAMLAAIGISLIWTAFSISVYSTGNAAFSLPRSLSDLLRHAAWFVFLILLLRPESPSSEEQRHLPAWLAIASLAVLLCGLCIELASALGWLDAANWTRPILYQYLALAVVGLILIEQLFRSVAEDSVWNIKPLCVGLAGQFAFEIYLYSNALLFNHVDSDALTIQGFVHAITTPLLVMAGIRSRNWTAKIRLSQKAAFHSATLLIAGIYLLFTAAVGYYVRYFGGDWGGAFQLALLSAAILGLGILLVSASMRAKMRVLVGKHFFTYRYDYREEWLRFTQTLSTHDSPQAMGEQVVRGLANMVESPAGGLWLLDASRGHFRQTARWNIPQTLDEEAEGSSLPKFLIASGWVVNLEEYRSYPGRYGSLDIPLWLSNIPNAWLVIPLMVGTQMIGFVVLASARTEIDVNWEINDLLRTAGCQAAGFLAKMQATEALLEARKFDAFNKMSAFVVHDLKNIVTQLALMLKNAERHRDNPEFQDDMLMTVNHSVERMRQLMMQLREGATPPGAPCGVNLPDIIHRVQQQKLELGRIVDVEILEKLAARGHEERLERVIGHMVQNAVDATSAANRVWIKLEKRGDRAAVEIGDTGVGMSSEFVREKLFKPFQSTKQAGMGIGAYESSQYIRELGGEMLVDSELGKGTRITMILPVFDVRNDSDLIQREIA